MYLLTKLFSKRRIVYDFGAHNGDNIPYYLLKFDKVVAIEANPILAKQIRRRFSTEISNGKLILENCVVSQHEEIVNFYLHKFNSVLSQFTKPQNLEDFDLVRLPSKRPTGIIREHGFPEYVKLDLEGLDSEVLSILFSGKIYPRYISAELHDIRVYNLLTSTRHYRDFKLLNGSSVSDIVYQVPGFERPYRFPYHSAGPMFEDIPTAVLSAEEVSKQLVISGLGWKDLHAKKR